MFSIKQFVLLSSLAVCASAFLGNTIDKILQAQRRAECQRLARSQYNVQYKHYCKVGRISVYALDVGGGLRYVPSNQLRYTGAVLRTSDVTFMTEQDGYGSIVARFNGAILKCSHLASLKRKTCVIPRSLRPWSGKITVIVFGLGYNPSAGYYMSGTPVCPRPGYEGDNCNRDINECQRYKGKKICQWDKGCVNTLGSYRCICPPGYKVSSKDFRLCEIDPPKITSPPSKFTVMLGSSVTLPCQHQASGPVTVMWQFDKIGVILVIAIKQANGAIQTGGNPVTLQQDGDLVVNKVNYGHASKFTCVVKYGPFSTSVIHTIQVESAPIVDFLHLVSGNYTAQHAYKVDDNVTIDCQVVCMPKSKITVKKDGQVLQSTPHVKVTQSKVNLAMDVEGARKVRIEIAKVQKADAGLFTCSATNKHGTTSKSLTLSVTK